MKRLLHIIPIFALACCGSVAAEILSPEGLAELATGEIQVESPPSDQPGGTVRVRALAQASAQDVWEVIVSCRQSFGFVNGLQSCEVIEDSGDRALLHQVTKQGWPAPTLDFIFESLRQPYSAIDFRLVQGNLKAMEGSWRFTSTVQGLLMDYQIRIKPELAVPDFMVSNSLRNSAPDMVACIRGLAGGSGSPELDRDDLQRCPGKPRNDR